MAVKQFLLNKLIGEVGCIEDITMKV